MGNSTSSAATAIKQLTINDVDDDCLVYFDRTGSGGVCKRWDFVSEGNWGTYAECFRIGEPTDDLPAYNGMTDEEYKNILQDDIQRYGRSFEEIIFMQDYGFAERFDRGTIKWIIERCPKLKRLTTGSIMMNNDDWLACSNLEAMCLTFAFEKGTESLDILFRNNKRLRRLAIFLSYPLNDRDFDQLDPGQLQCLQIGYCAFEFTAELASKLAESLVELKYSLYWGSTPNFRHLGRLKNLQSLDLKVRIEKLETKFIADMAKNCRKLERLFLVIVSSHVYDPNVFEPLFDLSYLRRLVIIVNKNHLMPSKVQRNRLLQRGTHLDFFVIDTCVKCEQGSSISDPSCRHYRGWIS